MYWIMTEDGWKLWLASYKVCDNHNKLEGVYRAQSHEDAVKEVDAHADHYTEVIDDYLTGKIEHKEIRSRLAQFKLYGGFGEKL